MKHRFFLPTLMLAGVLAAAGASGAAEVYFDTVSTAHATRLHGPYFGAFGGAAQTKGVSSGNRTKGMNFSDNTGWIAGVEFGYSWTTPTPFRPALELELAYLSNDINGSGPNGSYYRSEFGIFYGMANAVLALDFDDTLEGAGFLGRLKPYVGAGAGIGYGHYNNETLRRTDGRVIKLDNGGSTSFGYQLFAGVELELSEEFSIYGEYKYLNFYDIGGGEVDGADYSIWTFGVKVQY